MIDYYFPGLTSDDHHFATEIKENARKFQETSPQVYQIEQKDVFDNHQSIQELM